MADTLTITDNRTGEDYEIPIDRGVVQAMQGGGGRIVTASAIDGDQGE